MAQTPSNMIPLGTQASNFYLLNTITGAHKSLNDLKGKKGTVILFICNHCPFVIHINSEIVKIANYYINLDINFIAISSNDIDIYPQDAPDKMKILAENENYPFPYLFDETQEIAKAYDAACTPDIYVFDSELKLVYRGQFDDSRPGNNIPITGSDLRYALDCLIENKPNERQQKPSIGCNIKWKK